VDGLKGESIMDIEKILKANKEKSFVQRILHKDDYPILVNPPGYKGQKNSTSTHSMNADEADGRYFAYPSVIHHLDKLIRIEDRWEALDNALQSGNFIEFKTQKEATEFSKTYKNYWKTKKKKP